MNDLIKDILCGKPYMQTKKPVGRPPVADKARTRSISMNDKEYAKYMQFGGNKWLKALLAKLI